MKTNLHRLLKHQLQSIFGCDFDIDVLPDDIKALIDIVSRTYEENSIERRFLENTIEISSTELNDANAILLSKKKQLEQDIDERTSELKESEARYRELLYNMCGGVAMYLPLNDGQSFRCIERNAISEELLGALNDGLIGHAFPYENTPQLLSAFQNVYKYGGRQHVTLVQRKRRHISLWVEVDVYKLEKGEVVAIYNEMTVSKRAEEERETLQKQLQQAQKMETLGQLTGGIAHDFNNILASILGYTQLAMEEDIENEEVIESLHQVRLASERARELIQKMLVFSRGDSGAFTELSLRKVIDETIKILRPTLPSSINIDMLLNDGLPSIRGNHAMLMQVVMNACVNARDAIGEQGTISIGLHREVVDVSACSSCLSPFSADCLVLTVADTGSGIDGGMLNTIFEPFFSTKPSSKGTGMGLSVVHGIMHQHGGHILVNSFPGQGTEIKFLFPIDSSKGSVNLRPARQADSYQIPKHIKSALVVDDEIAVAILLGKFLKQQGIEPTVIGDSLEAQAMFDSNPFAFDLVITDQVMPELTGMALAGHMRSVRDDLPIIICTGFIKNIDPERMANSGILGILEKPIDKDAIGAMLSRILSSPQ